MSLASPRHVLIGNTFPLALLRREAVIAPVADTETVCALLKTATIHSFWGHPNTAAAASAFLGVDVSCVSRPVLTINADRLPVLDGVVFTECYILSPDYVENFRPAPNQEVSPENIIGWQCLKITWIMN